MQERSAGECTAQFTDCTQPLGANEHSSKSKYTLNRDVETTTQLASSLDVSPLFWATVHCENSEEPTLALSTSSFAEDQTFTFLEHPTGVLA